MIQLQVLNHILDTKDYSFITLNNITAEFFSDYKSEFAFVKAHIDAYGNVPDKESFLSTFPNFEIIAVTESTQYLVDELYKDRNTRYLANVFNQVRDKINTQDIDGAMSVFMQSTDNLVHAKHIDAVDIIRDTSRYNTYVERSKDYSKYYIKTGFQELDDLIGGWDKEEELVTIAARTNTGKSWCLLKCAIAAASQGLNVGLYSGEMSERKVGYRLDTLISHISNRKILTGDVEIQNDYKKYLENLSTQIPGSIKVFTPAMAGGSVGVNTLRAFIEKEHLDILCIDQHSLLDDDKHARNPVDRASNISRDLKTLQTLKKIPIIAVSQQNRSSTENGIGTEHISQSDRIAQDSTIVIMFEHKDDVMTLHLVKARDASNNKDIKYALDFDKGIFTYIPSESDALSGKACDDIRDEYEYTEESGEDIF